MQTSSVVGSASEKMVAASASARRQLCSYRYYPYYYAGPTGQLHRAHRAT